MDGMVRPIFRELKKQGWDYVKIDGAGDMLNSDKSKNCADHFKRIGSTPEESLRDWDRVAREELGKDIFILTCWGVGPGRCVIGLADGCRLGSDGFQLEHPAGEQLVRTAWCGAAIPTIATSWPRGLKDEDHDADLRRRRRQRSDTIVRPCVVAHRRRRAHGQRQGRGLPGRQQPRRHEAQRAGALHRARPALRRRRQSAPGGCRRSTGPSTIGRCWRASSGRKGRRSGSSTSRRRNRKSSSRTSGLTADREYLVFEFWTQTFLGKSQGLVQGAGAWMPTTRMQVFAIREARPHPWVLSTTRHISQGGVDACSDERWDAGSKTLSGKSAVVAGDPYVLTVHLPRRLQARKRRSRRREGRDRQPDGNRHGPHRAVGHQDRGVEDQVRKGGEPLEPA